LKGKRFKGFKLHTVLFIYRLSSEVEVKELVKSTRKLKNEKWKKGLLWIYPGIKSEFLRLKTFQKKTLFMQLRTRINSFRKKIVSMGLTVNQHFFT
jgi:hypothetical protein